MAKDRAPDKKQPRLDDDWVEVGKAPARPRELVEGDGFAPDEPPRAYTDRGPTPPWKFSVYTGAGGLVLMLAIYALPDLRSFETPWDESFPTAYALLPFPVFALIWGAIGVIGKQFRQDAARSALGILISLVGFGLIFSGVLVDPPVVVQPAAGDDRLEMTPAELQEWRSKKLRQP